MTEGPFGGPRPLAETQEIWFNASISINKNPQETFAPDDPEYRRMIQTFIESLLSQQPELDVAGGDVFILRDQWAILPNGAMTGYKNAKERGKDIRGVLDTVEIDIRFDEPVLVYTHVEDAERTTEQRFGNRFTLSDFRVLPKGLLRDERDRMRQEEKIDVELPLSTFL